jgi:DNA repair protein RecN (Recombination protein N)
VALRSISLRDFVIVREMTLDFPEGFTVLTGETGAGKSILVDAIQLVLGTRADIGSIREGASRTEICAEFDCTVPCRNWLQECGFDSLDTLLLRRTLDNQGKSRAWINGSAATATQLREIGDFLLDIHGQHAWQSLTRPDAVRALLDAYAGVETGTLGDLWHQWRKAQKEVTTARAAQDSLQLEQERLSWQIGELEKLSPGQTEWDELNANHSRLSNAQALIDAAQAAVASLESDETGALASLSRATTLLENQSHIDPDFRPMADVLRSSLVQAEDAAHSLNAYLRKTRPDPEHLAALDERMTLWVSLSRRYRRTPAELPGLLAGWKQDAIRLDAAANLGALEATERTSRQAYMAEALRLSKRRSVAAPRLAHAVTSAMQDLGMAGGRFEVSLHKVEEPSLGGLDEIVFLVAGHAGNTPRPIGKVASGGELSRIALAIAVTTSQLGAARTLIFDEVDAGVGGAVAETVGRLMKQLGKDRQVLAVTHLPQVASCGDHHLVVTKQSEAGVTVSSVTQVVGEQRVTEIARMLGGENISATSLAHAREMLEEGRRNLSVRAGATS